MAPHSPQRAPPPPPYAQPPPAYPQQWPVAPPNVYVSQVTANVNVHGYMGQYYQPPQPQYAPPPQVERPPRAHRRDRRGKRPPSPPPPQPPPYYVQYPHYYPAAQAQGAPLYHLPVYQPLVYGPYAYPPYYQEYQIPVEGEDKPDEYQQEVVMEQEAVDAYYAGAHYAPPYGPPVDGGVEYMPPMYLPPPPHPPPIPIQPQPPHQSTPHQFNVHAKNFVVQSHNQNKSYTPPEKSQEQKTPPATASAVESLPIKDLTISKGPGSPKQSERPIEQKPASDKASPTPKVETVKPAWVANEKAPEVNQIPVKAFPPMASASQVPAVNKMPPVVNKTTKGPAAPFSGGKQPAKPLVPQAAVPVQQAVSTPKAPFGNRQKRDNVANRSPTSETAEVPSPVAPVEHPKRDPPLPPSKAPMPISITLHSQGPPLIVTNKSPFGHSRKSTAAPELPPVPQPPPPAPTASDFPPPPTPRNRGDLPPPVVQPQPQPAPGKSWASLFSSKTAAVTVTASPPAPLPVEEPPSPTTVSPPATASIQKPVAKVPPFDASPSQITAPDKSSPVPRPAPAPTAISYSEKTSVNAISITPAAKPASPSQPDPEVREVPIQKEPTPALPVQPSPFADDPNSYRMGEFLSKYQLDNKPVTLLPRGLTNRSNYCYVNSILQALIACPPFYNMLKALPYQTRRGKSSTPVIDSMVELCYEFSPLALAARARGRGEAGAPPVPAGPPLDGAAGLRVLRALRPFVGSQEGRQEDAEEFLGCLLNSLNDEMLEVCTYTTPVPAGPPLDGAAGLRVLRALRPFVGSQEGRQEDAEEFLGCLLNSLNDEMLEVCTYTTPVPAGPPLDGAAGLRVLRALRPFVGSQEGRQEDAEEFLGCLLNSLNDEMLEVCTYTTPVPAGPPLDGAAGLRVLRALRPFVGSQEGRQEDAEEFLGCLLNSLNDEMLEVCTYTTPVPAGPPLDGAAGLRVLRALRPFVGSQEGRQEDAEEFLGCLLNSLNDEMLEVCTYTTPVPAGPPLDGAAGLRVLRALRPFVGSQEGRQEDAEEFLGCLLNSLNDEMLEVCTYTTPVPAGPPLDGAAGLRVLRALRPFVGSQEGRQEDAEEFLGCLLNSLNDEMLEVCTYTTPVPAGPPLDGAAGLRVLRALRPFVGSQEGRQEDAEEFLGCLLNSLNDEMLEVCTYTTPVPAGPPLDGAAGLRVLRALRPFVGSQEGRQEDAEEFLGCLLNSLNDEMLEVCTYTTPVPAGPPLDGAAGLRVLRALRPFVGSQEGRQEDAEEFLGCLLNSLNDEMLELMKLVEPEEPKEASAQVNGITTQEQPPEEEDDDDEWKVMGPRNKGCVERRWAARRTPVADIFRGRTRLRLHRAPQHAVTVTDAVQPFFTLQLDIERASNVKDALELLAGKDTLEGVSDAWQQLSLEQLPVVLLLHLKCFQLDSEGHTAKIVKNIDFPVDLKIDQKIMSSKIKYSGKQRLYKLFAVVYHEGVEAVKGHYVTDTFHGQAGWIRYDDSTVTPVSDAQVLKPKPPRMPYLLMYRRHDTLPAHPHPHPHRAPAKPE
ncbi:uncharacterized protein LOC133523376 isoform X2 [Cydia pomonella]|nr:uncharacterized protein LOC133523376 isoform X2 [Cydia pomonella]XP_061714888.1 uncharacterized protein LOC133523376 isoform X2 [Cydia pomonella]XP_061714890.1 uncharacterized protein LOC133523376 isoform X2 [Cydia pomonella]XP_061714891.1 uncharacterized protein LOC133523376 isoform X2 [Cydia pomonella]XP_061714892.1 uncharacterized protein LOC133523376 isoform X2 [Cydia pomonella]XP_061714893.1 uncharacterized protein LOC133523376 isoform X2 [Cydia pomonella]